MVGIGASAGGLEASTQLLRRLPADTGMAFVLVQHLDPTHQSALAEILSRVCAMHVSEVKDGMRVQPNRVYVIPPNAEMTLLRGTLKLEPRAAGGWHLPIDYFFRSLAEDQRSKAIGIVLSGNACDGTLGLKAIKAEGGITFAQDETTAKYEGMPHSAIASGCVDCVSSPEGIALELARMGRHPYVELCSEAVSAPWPSAAEDDWKNILILLRAATGVDFADYKHTTLQRRILRRMLLRQIVRLDHYLLLLQEQPTEVEALYHDVLINVTSFFRDPQTFEALRRNVFPRLLKNRPACEPLRVWVPGCSTGEEAYSLAMSLLEFAGAASNDNLIRIFATDVNESAIERARAGWYPESIAVDVSVDRLRRFFVKRGRGYQINKAVRDFCVFARQNVVQDPPFSRLDLISCRNLLTYLGPNLQQKLLRNFHYALKPEGLLIVGNSETIGRSADLFSLVDRKYKIYSRKSICHPLVIEYPPRRSHREKSDAAAPIRRSAPKARAGLTPIKRPIASCWPVTRLPEF